MSKSKAEAPTPVFEGKHRKNLTLNKRSGNTPPAGFPKKLWEQSR